MISNKILYSSFLLVAALIYLLTTSCTSVDYLYRGHNIIDNHDEEKDNFNLLTYNIKAIYEKENDQIKSLMSFVNNEGFDFVVFQELFDESTRDRIVNVSDTNFISFISRVDYNSFPEFLFQDAGLFMMSRHPRVDLSNLDFECDIKNSNGVIHRILEKEISRTNDFLANKSVLGALFEINDSSKLFLFTAHVQAAGTLEHKLFQLEQIGEFITTSVKATIDNGIVKDPANLSVILAGDFNSNAYSIDRFNKFRNALKYPRDLHKEYHGNFEEYTFRNRERRYDYILSYDQISQIKINDIGIKSIYVKNILDNNGVSISDHKGIQATLLLNQNSSRSKAVITKNNSEGIE